MLHLFNTQPDMKVCKFIFSIHCITRRVLSLQILVLLSIFLSSFAYLLYTFHVLSLRPFCSLLNEICLSEKNLSLIQRHIQIFSVQ
jgi:hypothetical protein